MEYECSSLQVQIILFSWLCSNSSENHEARLSSPPMAALTQPAGSWLWRREKEGCGAGAPGGTLQAGFCFLDKTQTIVECTYFRSTHSHIKRNAFWIKWRKGIFVKYCARCGPKVHHILPDKWQDGLTDQNVYDTHTTAKKKTGNTEETVVGSNSQCGE